MSRVGKRPVTIPSGVTASVEGQTVKMKGPKGQLQFIVHDDVEVKFEDGSVKVAPRVKTNRAQAMYGTARAQVANLVAGVTKGFEKKLEIELKYFDGEPVIREIERVSKPGRRVYASVKNLPRVNNGLGISVLSTPKGIMADHEAREANVGGEILFTVF